jgi:hypothetical protein
VPKPEMVNQRAREIALIDERNPDKFTEEAAHDQMVEAAQEDQTQKG